MTITPLKDAAGTITHFVAVKQDVTQRKLLEDQFRQSHKMESVGRLAGGIAHDFNNMLGVILGRTELAMLEVDAAQPIHEHLAEIEQAARRSAGLTRQLLAFARKSAIAPKELDLNESVTEELKMLRRLIGENIHLEWRPASALWRVMMDPSQLDQILANLCVNARDAITDTGRLVIATANEVVDEQFCATHSSSVPGEYVRLTVSDNGCGMSTDVLSHLFEPFFTTKAVGEGTGLGLATVYGAVKQSNGFITVTSEPGAGTTFTIFLPRHVSAGDRALVAAARAPLLRGHETILLVEDELMVLRLATRVLEESGYLVLPADSPQRALRMESEYAEAIDLVLTDVVMPRMNGRELANALVMRRPGLKRLYMSGFAAGSGGASNLSEDEAHFIAKPFTVESLTAKVREVLDRTPE